MVVTTLVYYAAKMYNVVFAGSGLGSDHLHHVAHDMVQQQQQQQQQPQQQQHPNTLIPDHHHMEQGSTHFCFSFFVLIFTQNGFLLFEHIFFFKFFSVSISGEYSVSS